MYITTIHAIDLPDLWFQAVYQIIESGRKVKVDRGSFKGQYRFEFDFFVGHVRYPLTTPIIPKIPSHYSIPDPVSDEYLYGSKDTDTSYIEYLMSDNKKPTEDYTYGNRLCSALYAITPFDFDTETTLITVSKFNQIENAIRTFKKYGYGNNQVILQIAQPSDMKLDDPPCLRHIDCKIQDKKLHFFPYFRSWDLWGGMPANLAAIATLMEYMAGEIGVKTGEIVCTSKGLHIYDYAEQLVKIRTGHAHI